MKNLIRKYKHAWVLLYILIYMPCFFLLEQTVTTDFHVIYSPIDDMIPFCELFVIPYFLWFGFVAAAGIYLFFTNVKDFYRYAGFLIIGMTIFLIISFLWPNGHMLRPATFERDNIFVDMVRGLYDTDTSTNIFPSIHVYNSLGVWIAVAHNDTLRKKTWVQIGTAVLAILIVLSTMFLKQHSFPDVVSAFVLALPAYLLTYRCERKNFSHKKNNQDD